MQFGSWVSVVDVARHLEASKYTLYQRIDHQRPSAHRVGRFRKFQRQEIDDWMRAGGAAEAGQKPEEEP